MGIEVKSSYALNKRYFVFLFVTYMLFGFAYASYSYQLRYYAEANGITYSFQSKLESISYLGVAVFILLVGKISDSVGREFGVSLTSAMGFLSPILALSSPSPIVFFLSVFFLNSAFLGGAVARNLLAIEIGGMKTGAVVGLAMTGTALAMIAGPLLGDMLKSFLGYGGVFVFSSISFAFSAILPLLIKTESRGVSRGGFGLSSIPKELVGFAAFATIDRFAYYIWVPLIFALTATEGIPSESSAVFYSIQNTAWLIFQFPMGLLADRADPRVLLSFSEVITAASAIFLASGIIFGKSFFLISIAFALLGLNIASWAPSYSSLFMRKTMGEERGKYLASINFYATIAAIPSPFIGGVLRSLLPGGFGHLLFAAALHAANAAFILKVK